MTHALESRPALDIYLCALQGVQAFRIGDPVAQHPQLGAGDEVVEQALHLDGPETERQRLRELALARPIFSAVAAFRARLDQPPRRSRAPASRI